MTDSLFSGSPDISEPQIDPDKDYYSELVGEGRKFKDEKELAKSKYHADLTIETMKTRMDQLRNDYMKLHEENAAKANLKDLIDNFKSKTSDTTPPHDVTEKPPIDLTEIESIVSRKLTETEQQRKNDANFNAVKSKLIERYGNNYSNVLNKQVEELGLTMEDVDTLARKSPQAFFRTLGLDQAAAPSFQAPPRSNQMSNSFRPNTQERTWSYYQDLYKKNPRLYHDRATAVQMQKDAIELGERFKDGDFGRYGD